jgi:hypothetical protein
MDSAFFLTLQALRRQLAAMPCDFYLIRLIHRHTRKALPGDRVWTAPQVLFGRTVSFLRARNREGYDVYFQPYAFQRNAGYILVDLDRAGPVVLDTMRANGHQPCVVIETSPGHLQAWIQVSSQPLEPAVATDVGRQLARLYQGDRASTDWRHLGRLAGFTNQKPQRILPVGWPPWVKVRHAAVGPASDGHSLIQTALRRVALRIPQRFPRPDWSIADLWIATELLLRGTPATDAKTILRLGSPQFPRRHADPEDYLRRTLAQALQRATFPTRHVASPPSPIHTRHSDQYS